MFILIIVAGYIGSYILTIQKENSMLREVHTEQSEELSQQDELIKVMMDYIQLNTQMDSQYIHPRSDEYNKRPI